MQCAAVTALRYAEPANCNFLNLSKVFFTPVKFGKSRKSPHWSPPLLCQNDSMVFTYHSVPLLAPSGWKWHPVRCKNHFIFLTPVTMNKYSFFSLFVLVRGLLNLSEFVGVCPLNYHLSIHRNNRKCAQVLGLS